MAALAWWTLVCVSPACEDRVTGYCACPSGTKIVEDTDHAFKCVANEDPDFGCSASDTGKCKPPHAIGICDRDNKCAIGGCDDEFADCDKDGSNGCEINYTTNLDHCGRCRHPCTVPTGTGTAECKDGYCGVACSPGQADCNGKWEDGCEVDGGCPEAGSPMGEGEASPS
ncbi:MAG: hypothetical protein JW940_10905 [Polyangiaceae bacterium]|nr:hypothetical protein [Polyangiaceae bacterium]